MTLPIFFLGGGGGRGGGIVSKMNYLIAPKFLVQDDRYKTKNMVTSFLFFLIIISHSQRNLNFYIVPF